MPPSGEWGTAWCDWSPFSYPFNLTTQPAASVPCGLTHAGLPIGLQIVGPIGADALVLRASRAFETAVALPDAGRSKKPAAIAPVAPNPPVIPVGAMRAIGEQRSEPGPREVRLAPGGPG